MNRLKHSLQVSYSGYSTSILASENPAFHFEFPSLDYSNKTRREKRPVGRKRESKEVEPLTISDMIDALHTQCVSEEKGDTPPQLLIECEGPCLKRPRYNRTTSQIWRDAIGQVVAKAAERLSRLEHLHALQSKLCEEVKSRSEEVLKNLKPVSQSTNTSTRPRPLEQDCNQEATNSSSKTDDIEQIEPESGCETVACSDDVDQAVSDQAVSDDVDQAVSDQAVSVNVDQAVSTTELDNTNSGESEDREQSGPEQSVVLEEAGSVE